jgi:hypothetical protein
MTRQTGTGGKDGPDRHKRGGGGGDGQTDGRSGEGMTRQTDAEGEKTSQTDRS